MIKAAATGDCSTGMLGSSVLTAGGSTADSPGAAVGDARLRAVIDEHADFIWRTLRRLGLPPEAADDAAQRVFIVASRRLTDIVPGAEGAFLFQTAVHVASRARRAHGRRREDLQEDPAREIVDAGPGADELVDRKHARALLDEALDAMDLDARAVFILFELEGKAIAEIAAMLDVPMGTVGSRLRRARAEFDAFIKRVQARHGARRTR